MNKIFNLVKSNIDKTTNNFCKTLITDKEIIEWGILNENELMEMINQAIILLNSAGYHSRGWNKYSRSWHIKSGKIGYLWVQW